MCVKEDMPGLKNYEENCIKKKIKFNAIYRIFLPKKKIKENV